MRIAFLACNLTLPDSPERRPDAFEHDQMMECLEPVFAARGGSIEAVRWDAEAVDWSGYDAVMIGSAWDYQDNLDAFLARLDLIESQTHLYNPSSIVRWNCRKTYLRELSDKGVATVPTLWLDAPDADSVSDAFDALRSEDLVLKRQVGANAEGQFRVHRGDPLPDLPEPMMAQPFLPAIQNEGELSLIYIDGAFSHGLIKSAAEGEYRIQSSYGGSERRHRPSDSDRAVAQSVLAALDDTPLYARVDMVRGDDGGLMLMELELIEPFLYPMQADDFGERVYDALARRLNTI